MSQTDVSEQGDLVFVVLDSLFRLVGIRALFNGDLPKLTCPYPVRFSGLSIISRRTLAPARKCGVHSMVLPRVTRAGSKTERWVNCRGRSRVGPGRPRGSPLQFDWLAWPCYYQSSNSEKVNYS